MTKRFCLSVFLSIGFPMPAATGDHFLALAEHLPAEASEALLEYAATGSLPKTVLNWCNTYAHDVLKLNLPDSALVDLVMITSAGFVPVLVGGWLPDRLAAKSLTGRMTVLALGLAIAALFLLPLP